MFFQPVIRLTPTHGGTYSADCAMFAPNGCYIADGTQAGWPKGEVGLPEIQPLQLKIVRHRGICIQTITTLRYHADGLRCSGKNAISVMAMLDGVVMGRAHCSTPCFTSEQRKLLASGKSSDVDLSHVRLDAVNAWRDSRPGNQPKLHVSAIIVASTGFRFNLEKVGPFGFTGRTLLFAVNASIPKSQDFGRLEVYHVSASVRLEALDEFDSAAVILGNALLHDFAEILY